MILLHRLLLLGAVAGPLLLHAQTNAEFHSPVRGPATGSLVIIGGGQVGPEILQAFARLAGGKDAPIVVVPTAGEADDYGPEHLAKHPLARFGFTHLSLLHTRDRRQADDPDFSQSLLSARGVWFDGGRQWRLVDSYLRTLVHDRLEALLSRGGVIAGTSAGATIQGSYLVRGAREGNHIMVAPGYEEGFGFLFPVAIDQHLLTRGRQYDLLQVTNRKPEVLGLGLDEGTAIVVRKEQFQVLGASLVAIYDANFTIGPAGKPFYFLRSGDCFDMARRKQLSCADLPPFLPQ